MRPRTPPPAEADPERFVVTTARTRREWVTMADEREAPPDDVGAPPAPAPRPDPLGLVSGGEGLLTGTVVCAAAIAYSARHVGSTRELCTVILGTVVVYWLAHLHACTIGASVSHDQHLRESLRVAARETWPIAGASAVPIVLLLVADVAGASLATAAWTALIATIVLLATYSYLAGARSGLSTWGRLASAAIGALLGVLVALLKVALH